MTQKFHYTEKQKARIIEELEDLCSEGADGVTHGAIIGAFELSHYVWFSEFALYEMECRNWRTITGQLTESFEDGGGETYYKISDTTAGILNQLIINFLELAGNVSKSRLEIATKMLAGSEA